MPEMNEPGGAAATGKDVYLKGGVVEVTFDGGLDVVKDKAKEKPPHWQLGMKTEDKDYVPKWRANSQRGSGFYSKRPIVLKVPGAGGKMDVTVKVKITESRNVSGKGKLLAAIGTLRIEGECPLSAGDHTVKCKIVDMPDEIGWYRGAAVWGLEIPSANMTLALNASYHEVFGILGDPLKPMYAGGVWVEALRMLCERARVVGTKLSGKKAAVIRITKYCFADHDLVYDTYGGAPSFYDPWPATFALERYLKEETSQATRSNCHDQGNAVHVLAGALGIRVERVRLEPYGYIHPTNLLGWAGYGKLCNSPFFHENTDAMYVPRFQIPGIPGVPMILAPEYYRTAFGHHVFCGFDGKIFDACAGPHLGTEDPAQYCSASIDDHPALYMGLWSPGTPPLRILGDMQSVT